MKTKYTSQFLYENGDGSMSQRSISEIECLPELVKQDLERHHFQSCRIIIEIYNFLENEDQ